MTNYTASDFAKAEFARHPDGRVAARTGVDWAQWAFKCSECQTDEERNECDGHDFGPDGCMAGNGWVPVQENPRPLTPDAITDEMVSRAIRKGIEFGWFLEGDVNVQDVRKKTRSILESALGIPARPEGAEKVEKILGSWHLSDALGMHFTTDALDRLADHIAEEMSR